MWPSCLSRGPTVARLLELQVRIPQGAWMAVSFKCCLLSDASATGRTIVLPSVCVCVCVHVCVCVCVCV